MRFKIDFQTKRQHLTDQEIALWVDAATEDRVEEIPGRIAMHVETCLHCKEKIIEISQSTMLTQSAEISEADKKIKQQFKPVPVIHLLTIIKVAAAAVVLIGIGTLLAHFLFPEKQDPAMLFAQNFAPYPDLITEKSSTWQTDSVHQWLATGLDFYRVKKFDSAFIVFKHLYRIDANNDTISFYFANTILANESDPEPAIEIFTLLSGKETVFAELSRWYLALALLKNGDPDGAKTQLTSLIKTSQYYRQKAEVILKELE